MSQCMCDIKNVEIISKNVLANEQEHISSTLSVLKFAQYYFSRTPRCANLSTARIFVRADICPREKVQNQKCKTTNPS